MQTISHSSQHANVNDAIEAIEHALGLSPEGDYLTVASRLIAIENELAGSSGGSGVFVDFKTNDIDEVSNTLYVGQSKPNSENWLIQKLVDSSGDLDITYANESNNNSITIYNDAWTNRLTLTYSNIGDLIV
jgi:hypothetical protein